MPAIVAWPISAKGGRGGAGAGGGGGTGKASQRHCLHAQVAVVVLTLIFVAVAATIVVVVCCLLLCAHLAWSYIWEISPLIHAHCAVCLPTSTVPESVARANSELLLLSLLPRPPFVGLRQSEKGSCGCYCIYFFFFFILNICTQLDFFNIPDICACYHSMRSCCQLFLLLLLLLLLLQQPLLMLLLLLSLLLLFMSSFPIVVAVCCCNCCCHSGFSLVASLRPTCARRATCFHFTLPWRFSLPTECAGKSLPLSPSLRLSFSSACCCCHFVQFCALIFKYNPKLPLLLLLRLCLALWIVAPPSHAISRNPL